MEVLAKDSFATVYMAKDTNNSLVVLKKTSVRHIMSDGSDHYLNEYKYLFSDVINSLVLSNLKLTQNGSHYCENFAKQLIASLAVAESVLEFEHRDLHSHNVLVLKTNEKSISFKMNGKQFKVELNGYKLTIIDTTYSRVKFANQIHFNDLTNCLRKVAKSDCTQLSSHKWIYKKQCELTQNDWSRFCPKSNIYWCELLLKHIYKRIDRSMIEQCVESQNAFQVLTEWTNTITQYNSVLEFHSKQLLVEKVIFIQRKFRANQEMKIETILRNDSQLLRETVIAIQMQFIDNEMKSELKKSKFNLVNRRLLDICHQKDLIEIEIIYKDYKVIEALAKGSVGTVFMAIDFNDSMVVIKRTTTAHRFSDGRIGYLFGYRYLYSDIMNGLLLSGLKFTENGSHYCENFATIFSNHYVFKDEINNNDIKCEYFLTKMSYAGKPITDLKPISPKTAISLARQLIASLAVAESALQFEHRDLHCNNVLVMETDRKFLYFKLNGHPLYVESNGFKLTIIDTTASRSTSSVKTFFNDLTHCWERLLRMDWNQLSGIQKIYAKQCQLTQLDWSRFCPKSNIEWCVWVMEYLFDNKIDKTVCDQYLQLFEKWIKTISQYNSVLDFHQKHNRF